MTCCVVLGALAAATASTSSLRLHGNSHPSQDDSVTVDNAAEVRHHFVICNAYASQSTLEVVQVSNRQVVTGNDPLAYKQCKDLTISLHDGEQFDFKAAGVNVGTFFANGLPKSAASLLLIAHRHSSDAMACSFQSHAFANVQSPQIAVIDACVSKGDKQQPGALKITELVAPEGEDPISESLRFNSVIAVSAGKYKISLTGKDDTTTHSASLNAVGSNKFVVMRLGTEDGSQSTRYPKELVVFPNGNGGLRTGISLITIALAFLSLRDLI